MSANPQLAERVISQKKSNYFIPGYKVHSFGLIERSAENRKFFKDITPSMKKKEISSWCVGLNKKYIRGSTMDVATGEMAYNLLYPEKTMADWKEVAAPKSTPDYISRSGSHYWYGVDKGGSYIIRRSEHWGEVASCLWRLYAPRGVNKDTIIYINSYAYAYEPDDVSGVQHLYQCHMVFFKKPKAGKVYISDMKWLDHSFRDMSEIVAWRKKHQAYYDSKNDFINLKR